MKKYILLVSCVLILCLCTACVPEKQISSDHNLSAEVDTSRTQISPHQDGNMGIPPLITSVESEEGFQVLHDALKYDDEELTEFFSNAGKYGISGIHTRKALEDFWEKTITLPLPNLESVPNLESFGLEYYKREDFYSLWYVAGGRQYRLYYYPGPIMTTDAVLNPVVTGELYGAEIALGALPEDSPWEYRADFYLNGYNVQLFIRNDLGVSNPQDIFLNYSKDSWVTVDKNENATFHLGSK